MTNRRRGRLRPAASSPEAEARMKRTRRRDTRCEVEVRRRLHARGYRYRVDQKVVEGLRRRADLVFGGPMVAVFVDGCFWHGCPIHATWPKANAEFWRAKIEANRRRDRDTDRRLLEAGWSVVRVWEHVDPDIGASVVAEVVDQRRDKPTTPPRIVVVDEGSTRA